MLHQICSTKNPFDLRFESVTLYSYKMGTHVLPDIYTLSPCALGVYIRQTISAHATTITRHSVIGHKPVYVTKNSSKH